MGRERERIREWRGGRRRKGKKQNSKREGGRERKSVCVCVYVCQRKG